MTTANETPIVRAYEAFGTGDLDAIRNECFAQDIKWTWPCDGPLSGVYKNVDEVLDMFVKLSTDSGGTFNVAPESIAEFGDFVLVRSRAAWTGKEGAHDDPYIQVFRINDGRASECSILLNDTALWDRFPG